MKRRSISSVAQQVRTRALKLKAASEPTIDALDEFIRLVDLLGSYFERALTAKTQRLAVDANRHLVDLQEIRKKIESGGRDPQSLETNRSALHEALGSLIRLVDRDYPR